MTRTDLTSEWAWSQIEAMADGSLHGEDRQRMRQAMRRDPRLRAAVKRARSLRQALGQANAAPVPGALRRRLLSIPAKGEGRRLPADRSSAELRSSGWGTSARWRWAAVCAAVAVAVLGAVIATRPASPPLDSRTAALREFSTAMRYLQHSAVVTSNEVTRELGSGLREAYIVGRSVVLDEESNSEDGG